MIIDGLIQSSPVTIAPGESLHRAAVLMWENAIGSLVVAEDGKPVGMVTDRDLAIHVLCDRLDAEATPVSDLMHTPVQSILVGSSVRDAARQMRRAGVRRLPVVGPHGTLAGVISYDALLVQLGQRLDAVRRIVHVQTTGDQERVAEASTEGRDER